MLRNVRSRGRRRAMVGVALVAALLVAGSAVPSAASPPAERKPGQQLTAPPPGAPVTSPLDRLVKEVRGIG